MKYNGMRKIEITVINIEKIFVAPADVELGIKECTTVSSQSSRPSNV